MRIIAFVVLALLTAPGVAVAKGPLSGSVSGPGLAAPIKLGGTGGEWDENSPLALLTADTGIYDQSKHPPRPAGELGPRYEVRLVFPRHSTGKPDYVVRQRLYPYAENGPTVYTLRGQPIFDDTFRTTGGWYQVPRVLIKRLDLPARAVPARATVAPESPAGAGPSALWAIAAAAILALVAWRATAARSRRRR
jgi:hypothetical protein